jgi:putative aldouronate transport system substrate-binding protein
VSWGKEGVTFKVVDGKRVWIKPPGHEADDQKKLYGLGTDGAGLLFDFASNLTPDVDPNYAAAMVLGRKYEDPLYPVPQFNEQELATIGTLVDPFMVRANEGIINFLSGKRPMADWDKFVAEQKALGTDQLLKILNDTYARSK